MDSELARLKQEVEDATVKTSNARLRLAEAMEEEVKALQALIEYQNAHSWVRN